MKRSYLFLGIILGYCTSIVTSETPKPTVVDEEPTEKLTIEQRISLLPQGYFPEEIKEKIYTYTPNQIDNDVRSNILDAQYNIPLVYMNHPLTKNNYQTTFLSNINLLINSANFITNCTALQTTNHFQDSDTENSLRTNFGIKIVSHSISEDVNNFLKQKDQKTQVNFDQNEIKEIRITLPKIIKEPKPKIGRGNKTISLVFYHGTDLHKFINILYYAYETSNTIEKIRLSREWNSFAIDQEDIAKIVTISNEYNNKLNILDSDNVGLLQEVCRLNRLDLVKDLLDHDAWFSTDFSGKTPLYEAYETNNFDLISFLIDHGANPNLPCGIGKNLLYNHFKIYDKKYRRNGEKQKNYKSSFKSQLHGSKHQIF
jgi:hypothetical protein